LEARVADGVIEIARVAGVPCNWTGTGFRVFCIELRAPTEYVHVAVLGDTDIRAVATKGFMDIRLLDSWADSMAEMVADAKTVSRSAVKWLG